MSPQSQNMLELDIRLGVLMKKANVVLKAT